MTEDRAYSRGLYERALDALREPLVHFVVLGASIFALGNYLEERSSTMRIVITQDQIRRLSNNFRLQYGQDPSPEHIKAMEARYVEEEILYREALKLGLDANDEIIRRRLIQKYEFLQQDIAIPAEPTQSELIDYYDQHAGRYRQPRTISFSHVYFSPDRRGEDEAREAAQAAIADLNLHMLSDPSGVGDRFAGNHSFTAMTRDALASIFGHEGLAEQIFNAPSGHWVGPIRSGVGWHAVRVIDTTPPRQIPFERARADVRQDYLDADRDRGNAEHLARLRRKFQIDRE